MLPRNRAGCVEAAAISASRWSSACLDAVRRPPGFAGTLGTRAPNSARREASTAPCCSSVILRVILQPLPSGPPSRNGRASPREFGDQGRHHRRLRQAPAPGQTHTLQAEIDGSRLKVLADGKPAWDGDLGAAATLAGPAGIRSDNVRLNMREMRFV